MPQPTTELHYADPFELLISVILSAQATDVSVNKATTKLFPIANTPKSLLDLGVPKLKGYIKTIGLYNNKAENIIKTCRLLLEHFDGQVPRTRDALESLPGVGRKTANCVLGEIYNVPSMVIDTHMIRIMGLLNFTKTKDAKQIELDMMEIFDKKDWVNLTHLVIDHGRAVCIARRPQCGDCVLVDICPSSSV